MSQIVDTLRPGGDARGDWRQTNALALNQAAMEQRLGKALADIERLKRDRRGGTGGWTDRGYYDSTETYAVDDVVSVIGSGQGTWLCKVAHGPGPGDDHAPWLGEDDGTTQYWRLLFPSAEGFWI